VLGVEINNLDVSLTNVPSGHDYLLNEMELEDLGLLELAALNPDEAEINFIEEETLLELPVESISDLNINLIDSDLLDNQISTDDALDALTETLILKDESQLSSSSEIELDLQKQKFFIDHKQVISLLDEENREKLNEYVSDIDNLTREDLKFSELFLSLIQNEDYERIEILDKARELNLTVGTEESVLNLLENKALSNEFIDTYLNIAAASSASDPKLKYLELNKFEISALDENTQKLLLDYVSDTSGQLENDLLFANSFKQFTDLGDTKKIDSLNRAKLLNLTAAQEEQFISFLWKDSSLADTYLSLVNQNATQDKLDFLSENGDSILSVNSAVRQKVYERLVDANDLTKQDALFAESILLFSKGLDTFRLELIDRGVSLNLTAEAELAFINGVNDLKLSDKVLDPYLSILEMGDSEKIKFFEENKYSISDLDEVNQDRMIRYIRDRRNLAFNDVDFAQSLLYHLGNNDTQRIELLDTARALNLNSEQEKKIISYVDDASISADFIKANFTLMTSGENSDKLAFLETNKYLISALSEDKQAKIFTYLQDSESSTENDIRFTNKLLKFFTANNSRGVEILDAVRSKNLSADQETAFLDYVAITNLDSKVLPEEIAAYVDNIDREPVQNSQAYNALLKQGDTERLALLKATSNMGFTASEKGLFYSYLLDKNLSIEFLNITADAIKSDVAKEKIDLIDKNRYLLSSADETLRKTFFNYLKDSSSETSEDTLYAAALLKLSNDPFRLGILAESRTETLTKEQEKNILDLLLDTSVSKDFSQNYLNLAKSSVNSETLAFFLENKSLIDSYPAEDQSDLVSFISNVKLDDALADTLSVLLDKGHEARLATLYNNFADFSENPYETNRFLNYLVDDKLSDKVLDIYLDLVANDVDSERIALFDENKYSLSKSSEKLQNNAFEYITSENADLFFRVLSEADSEKISLFETQIPSVLTKDDERFFMEMLLDKDVSVLVSAAYLNMLENGFNSESLNFMLDNRQNISSLDSEIQKNLIDYISVQDPLELQDSDMLQTLLSRQDAKKIDVFLAASDMALEEESKTKLYQYLDDKLLAASFSDAFLDILTQENNENKLLYLDKNRYQFVIPDSSVRDKALDLLVDKTARYDDDILNANLYLRYERVRDSRKLNLFNNFLETDLNSDDERLFKNMLVDTRVSSGFTKAFLNLSSSADSDQELNLVDTLKFNYKSLLLMDKSVQNALAVYLAPENINNETRTILNLSFAIAKNFDLSRENNLDFIEILKSSDSLNKLKGFLKDSDDLILRDDEADLISKQEYRNSLLSKTLSSTRVLGLSMGEFLGGFDSTKAVNFQHIDQLIKFLSQNSSRRAELRQDQEQVQLSSYQSRLGLYDSLIQEENNKGDKADLTKLNIFQARKTEIENKIKQLESLDENHSDSYLDTQVDKIKDTLSSLTFT